MKILSDYRKVLDEFFLFRIPPAPLVDSLLDKKTQYQLMKSNGLNVPLTVYSDENNLTAAVSGKIGFPCLFKPCRSYIWRQVPGRFKARVVNSPGELQVLSRNFASLGLTFLVQEIIPGGNECLHSYLETGYKKPDSPSIQKPGVLFMHLGWDLQAALSSGENRWQVFFSWLLLIRKVSAFTVFNLSDIKPIIGELLDYCRKLPK